MSRKRFFGGHQPDPSVSYHDPITVIETQENVEKSHSLDHHQKKRHDRPTRSKYGTQRPRHVAHKKPAVISTAITQVSLDEYLGTIKTQPHGRRMFSLRKGSECITNALKQPIYFSKKDESKQARKHLLEKYGIETLVTKGPDHPDHKGE